MSDKAKGLAYISVTIFCWGILAIAIKSVSQDISSLYIAWFRFAFSVLLLIIYHLFRTPEHLNVLKKPPLLGLIAGLCLGINYIGFTKGIELTSPSVASILIQLGPLTLALFGIFIFKEKISRYQTMGFIISSFGFAMFYKDQLTKFLDTASLNLGVLSIVVAALAWSVYAIIQKKLVKKIQPSQMNLLVFGVPAILLLFFINPLTALELSSKQIMILLFLGVNTLIAYGSLGEAFKYLPANNISILITLNPLITLACVEVIHFFGFDWIPYAPISPVGYLGALCVITGAITIVGAQRKALPKA